MIKVASVRSQMIDPGYGYIRVTQFQVNTGEEVGKALNKPAQGKRQEAQRPDTRPAQQPGAAYCSRPWKWQTTSSRRV